MKLRVNYIFCAMVWMLVMFGPTLAQAQKKKSPKSGSAPEQAAPATQNSVVLATVGGDPITLSDLESAYKRNMNRKNSVLTNVHRDSVVDFLNLYIKYRLKVKDAYSRGFEKDSAVLSEVNSNRKLLSETFLFDKKIVEPNVSKYVERRKKDIQVAVMVMTIPQGENSDTSKAYEKARRCIELVKNGADFLTVAKDSSDDKETREKGGVLPYFTSLGGIIRQLEDAAYSLKPGEVSPAPIRARFVYLVVKNLQEVNRTSVRGSQILVPIYEGEDTTHAVRRADSLAATLKNKSRAEFAEVARKISTDKNTADKGGDFGQYYSRSLGFESDNHRLIPEFEEAFFKLKDGEVGTVHTLYGAHVIRRDSTKVVNPEEERDNVKKIYKKYYFEDDKRVYLEDTKKKLGFAVNEESLNSFVALIEPNKTTLDTTWFKKFDDATKAKTLYTMPNRNITIGGMIDSLRKRSDMRGSSLSKNGINNALNKIADPYVAAEAAKTLEREYPEFASLIREFRDGILLFKVEEQEVWSKLKFDSTAARVYWDTTKTRYMTEYKYDVTEIYSLADTTAKKLYDQARQTKNKEEFETEATLYTQRDGYREKKGNWGVLSVRNSKLAQLIDPLKPKSGDLLGPLPFEKGFTIVRVNDVQTPRQKTFEEAIPDFAPAFQDLTQKRLSEGWISRLREKYEVKIDQAKINSLFKN